MQYHSHIMRPVMLKEERHNVLSEMVSASKIRSQAELVKMLRKRGFIVTQASVSRDLEEMGIEKRDGVYRLDSDRSPVAAFGPVSLALSGSNLIVGRCRSGLASAFAVHLDELSLDEIVGTIAGDDTVFIAVENGRAQKAVHQKLRRRFGD
jgi:transcriptional regulator of arginine metabolism